MAASGKNAATDDLMEEMRLMSKEIGLQSGNAIRIRSDKMMKDCDEIKIVDLRLGLRLEDPNANAWKG